MALERFPLDFKTTLRGGMDVTQVTIPLTSIAGLPTSGVFRLRIDDEVVYVTGGLGTLDPTVTRGMEGTVAATHAAAASVEAVVTPGALDTLVYNQRYRFKSGRYYGMDVGPNVNLGTMINQLGRVNAYPFPVGERTAFDRASIEVTTALAGDQMMVGIHADDGTLYPGALLSQLGAIPLGTVGQADLTLGTPVVLDPGLYWIAYVEQGAGAFNANGSSTRSWGLAPGSWLPQIGRTTPASSNGPTGYQVQLSGSQVVGTALPNPYPVGNTPTNVPIPALHLRAA
jgi:hypothetical protein